MKKKIIILTLVTLLASPSFVMANEWTIGSWDIWSHRAVNTSYAIGWNDNTSSLLFRLYPDIDPICNEGLALFEVFLPRNQSIDYVSAYKELEEQPILDMLKNYTIIATEYDRQYQNGTGALSDAWYVNAYIYTLDDHSITNENKTYFDLHRIWNDTTNSPKYWQPLPAFGVSNTFTSAQYSSDSVICKLNPDDDIIDTITDTTTDTIPSTNNIFVLAVLCICFGTIIAIPILVITKKNK